jgi:hypothetical protein
MIGCKSVARSREILPVCPVKREKVDLKHLLFRYHFLKDFIQI